MRTFNCLPVNISSINRIGSVKPACIVEFKFDTGPEYNKVFFDDLMHERPEPDQACDGRNEELYRYLAQDRQQLLPLDEEAEVGLF